MINHPLTRITVAAAIALGTLGSTLAGAAQTAAPAAAQEWHHDHGHWDRDHRWHADGWRDHWGHWHAYGYAPAQRPGYYARGPRYYDRVHGYWRDRLGYWNPHSGAYISFHF
jgi:hypothetical protein